MAKYQLNQDRREYVYVCMYTPESSIEENKSMCVCILRNLV